MDCFGTYSTRVHTWTALIFETFDLLEHVCIFWHQFWNIYAMASFSGMCTHGQCYAVFTWLNLPVRSRVHVRHQYVCPRADMVDATPYSITWKFQTQKRSYAINIFAHVQTWSMLRHVHLIEQWKLLFNNENCKCQDAQKKLEKVVKSQMLAMFIFYCKFHMKVLTTENVMLHLHGKNQAKWLFSKKTCVFTIFVIFFVKKMDSTKDSTGMIHDKMVVFTIHLLRAQERLKHCWQWMKIHFFARL